jgi:ribosomal protein S18 acetylase RimI-like enzyme
MSLVIEIRKARPQDAGAIANICEASWREAYQGLIPGLVLDRVVSHRDAMWAHDMMHGSRHLAVLDLGNLLAGYVLYGNCRHPFGGARGEIEELYLVPECQGLGMGQRLFRAIRNDMREKNLAPFVVWSLADNTRANAFYEKMEGRFSGEATDMVEITPIRKVAYLFT